MRTFLAKFIIFIFIFSNPLFAFRILFYAPGYGGSRMLFHTRLANAIANAGHEVITLEPEYLIDPAKFKGLNKVEKRLIVNQGLVNASSNVIEKYSTSLLFAPESAPFTTYQLLLSYNEKMPEMCENLLQRKEVLAELKEFKFDAYFYEPISLCAVGIGQFLGIKTQIMFTSLPLMEYVNDRLGLHWPTSHLPAISISLPSYNEKMGYFERVWNLLAVEMAKHAWASNALIQEYTQIFRRNFGADFPDIGALALEADLCFVNSNEFTDFPRPSQSNIVQIGGIGLDPERIEALDSEMENEMEKGRRDGQKSCVALVAFGTFVPTKSMPSEFKQNFLNALGAVERCHFIMKVDKVDLEEMRNKTAKMSNIFLSSWLPQSSILAHPNLSLFISHSGLNSIVEAATFGVPTVAIPFMLDHFRNARLAERNGWAIQLDKATLYQGHQKLQSAIEELLDNPRYRQNAQRTARLIRNLPLSPEQRLQKYLHFLLADAEGTLPEWQNPGRHLSFWAYYNLDIFVPLLIFAQIALYLFTKLLIFVAKKMIGMY